MMFYLILLIVAASVTGASIKPIPEDEALSRIVGGSEIDISKAPYQLSLGMISYYIIYTHFCGASVLGKRVALTAARCLIKKHGEKLAVAYGLTEISSIRQKNILFVIGMMEHPGFNPDFDNDIALLVLENDLPLGELVKPINLPTTQVSANEELIMTGWGSTEEDGNIVKHLRAVKVVAFADDKCSTSHGDKIDDDTMCAGIPEGGKDSCRGDSGGPLVLDNIQYGIATWDQGCGKQDKPGLYTKVLNYVTWIKDNAQAFQ